MTEVKGLTLRDVRDCLILAFYDSRLGREVPSEVDELLLEDMSAEAISQNLGCWIERYMGIFPNLPERFRGKG